MGSERSSCSQFLLRRKVGGTGLEEREAGRKHKGARVAWGDLRVDQGLPWKQEVLSSECPPILPVLLGSLFCWH